MQTKVCTPEFSYSSACLREVPLSLFRYILRRLVFLVFLILGVSLLVFLISHLVPADPVVAFVSQRNMSDPEVVAAFKAKWGLDQPLYVQYLIYLNNLVRGDLGTSIRTHRPVLTDLAEYFPATVELATFATIIAIVFGMIFGVISATMRNSVVFPQPLGPSRKNNSPASIVRLTSSTANTADAPAP